MEAFKPVHFAILHFAARFFSLEARGSAPLNPVDPRSSEASNTLMRWVTTYLASAIDPSREYFAEQ